MHPNAQKAGMTEEKRRAIREAKGTLRELAGQFGCTTATIRKWRAREDTTDRSHRPNQVRRSPLTPEQALWVQTVRNSTGWSLDLLARLAQHFFLIPISRSTLHAVLQAGGVSRNRKVGALWRENPDRVQVGVVRVWVRGKEGMGSEPWLVYYAWEGRYGRVHFRVFPEEAPSDSFADERRQEAKALMKRFGRNPLIASLNGKPGPAWGGDYCIYDHANQLALDLAMESPASFSDGIPIHEDWFGPDSDWRDRLAATARWLAWEAAQGAEVFGPPDADFPDVVPNPRESRLRR